MIVSKIYSFQQIGINVTEKPKGEDKVSQGYKQTDSRGSRNGSDMGMYTTKYPHYPWENTDSDTPGCISLPTPETDINPDPW